jgi:hypothetical protein
MRVSSNNQKGVPLRTYGTYMMNDDEDAVQSASEGYSASSFFHLKIPQTD